MSSSSRLRKDFPSKEEHHKRFLEKRKRKAGKKVLIVLTSPPVFAGNGEGVGGSRYVVAGCNDGTIHVWDIADVLRKERTKEERKQSFVVGGTSNGESIINDDRSCRKRTRSTDSFASAASSSASEDTYMSDFKWRSENGSVYHMTFTKDVHSTIGETYLLAACDRGVAMWNWNSILTRRKHVSPSKVFAIPRRASGSRGALGPIPECNKVVMSRDGQYMYVAAGDRKAYVFQDIFERTTSPTTPPVSLAGHSEYVHTLALAPRYGHVYSGSEDGTIRVWRQGNDDKDSRSVAKKRRSKSKLEATKRRDSPLEYVCVKVIQTSPASSSRKSWVSAMDVDRDENWLVVAGGVVSSSSVANGQLLLIHLQTLAVLRRWEDETGPLTSVHFTRTTKTVVTSGSDGTVGVWSRLGGGGGGGFVTTSKRSGPQKKDQLRKFKARSSKSLNTAHIDETLGVLAVGGASPLVDIYPNGIKGGCCAFSLECSGGLE